MVGYAYSMDPSLGYGYILIKCYNCDDISLVDPSMPYAVYRVSRASGRVETLMGSLTSTEKRLNLKYIRQITELLTISEYDFDYPVVITWAVTPSGVCNKTQARELDTAFPIAISLIEKESTYINITPVCFKNSPFLLDVTFLCRVLNESAYLWGIFESDIFSVCGGEIFCSKSIETISKKSVLSHVRMLDFCEDDFDETDIVSIQRQCMRQLTKAVRAFLEGDISRNRMLRLIKLCVARALNDIKSMSVEFLMRSGATSSTDINYMTIDQLMMIFAFPVSHTDTRRLIRTNKNRFHRYKTFDKPARIYKGRLYYM